MHNNRQQADLGKLSPFLQKDAKMPPSRPNRCGGRWAYKMKRAFLATVLLALWFPAVGADAIVVDLVAGTVGGLDMNQSGPTLKKKLGARVTKTTEQLEGEPSELWVVSFGTSAIRKHWNGFSFTDQAFRTKEGLGIGATVADFDKAYGQSAFSEEEGCHWIFEDKRFIFALESGCTNDRQQKVNEVWVATRPSN